VGWRAFDHFLAIGLSRRYGVDGDRHSSGCAFYPDLTVGEPKLLQESGNGLAELLNRAGQITGWQLFYANLKHKSGLALA
jgi:hypothetical protein